VQPQWLCQCCFDAPARLACGQEVNGRPLEVEGHVLAVRQTWSKPLKLGHAVLLFSRIGRGVGGGNREQLPPAGSAKTQGWPSPETKKPSRGGLTLHRLGLSPELTKSLGTTNGIEAFMSQLGNCTDKVDRWHNSDQILRWTASAAMDHEPRMNRIRGYQYLKLLRLKLRELVSARSGAKSPAHNLEEVVEIR
jgi:hypothetical protein